VLASLKAGQSGITANAAMKEHGFRSQVAGDLKIDIKDHVDKRTLRFMGPGAAYAHIAMSQAIADAGLSDDGGFEPAHRGDRGLGRAVDQRDVAAHQSVLSTGATKRIGPFAVPKCMSSTISANLDRLQDQGHQLLDHLGLLDLAAQCIGVASEQIMMGKQDIMFAGGGEELDWTLSCLFDAMGAMSSKYNDTPESASRAFDADRDGFVIAGGGGDGGAGDLEHAKARGAKIYAEVTGFAATSDGHDMVAPSGEGGERAMRLALQSCPRGRKS
jgi:3-oxoacyl-[acyl-carrier-protein] synthase-1